MNIKKRHVWGAIRIKINPTSIYLREHKPLETLSVLVFVGMPLLCLLWIIVRPTTPGYLQFDWPLIIAVVFGFIGFAILILYRPPRVLCFYPLEQIVYQQRVFLFIRFPKRWHDLSQVKPVLQKTGLVIERDEGVGSALLMASMFLLGPFGIILALASGGNRRSYSTFALTYKGQRGKPLAVVTDRTACQKAIDAYNDAV